jgi:hypothetical protein
MAKLTAHWTERGVDDFLYSVTSGFVRHIEKLLEPRRANQADLARRLCVTEGRISQVLNNPGNLTLRQVIKYARALGEKVALVTYDDNDPANLTGPVDSEVFERCWEQAGKPTDLFSLDSEEPTSANCTFALKPSKEADCYVFVMSATASTTCAIHDFGGTSRKTASTGFSPKKEREYLAMTGVQSHG